MQNTSHAVMSQRTESKTSADDFPTPPWATRALIEHVLREKTALKRLTCWEPACGAGHMSKVLVDYFGVVRSSDAYQYGYGSTFDFVKMRPQDHTCDWVITNPPFKHAQAFVLNALEVAKSGVAILARSVFLESVGRYRSVFRDRPPSAFAQFVERVPMVKGRLDQKASTATGYAWFVWRREDVMGAPRLIWIPPCRKELERTGDYDPSPSTAVKGASGYAANLEV
ncbi:SAM-dependent methyltransferase [Bradyrhizobium sp. WBOS7]|uniref:SAM-dependent methyltransferase n=1 Tax=Bradyrhizobium betae TaxID=244734 RepID=A0AAE9NAV5_9BRAD|nr:SAM-dependent methyltransferase [Bradyrhizobium sp. WBOS2]MDD1574491.1 SAM-dependent methyltransferase [Bradyrhizobium sp. WBOS1]MDD1580527.1 SAM-dependent methyltransferase [Bradyrhizobium sp. WBOS7]MDD1604212.1 SAM-dependent methyltransferase [Bradyrhizobium sp. WBOS16]UUO35544.1 SAM-dependent methyltransferase [Bradyrhizobium sp. WBOS01]UUO41853.1 SAM-dependent methyltransferase [Bradyrhizobium sp. WBOS02]UUO56190.1 SAM-dependent methyltransferase [Bradyrhizobium sp. WBOS07]UUO66183.1 